MPDGKYPMHLNLIRHTVAREQSADGEKPKLYGQYYSNILLIKWTLGWTHVKKTLGKSAAWVEEMT